MKLETTSHYYIYLVTNEAKTELEASVTGDLSLRLYELERQWRMLGDTIEGERFCRHLVWWEHVTDVLHALERSRQVQEFSRRKQEQLVNTTNPDWEFLNRKLETTTQLYL